MSDRRLFNRSSAIVALSLAFALPGAARAAEIKPFSFEALKAAQDAGRPVVVEVTASWCSTCQAQKPIVASLLTDSKFKSLLVLDADFDAQKNDVRRLKVREQSTFIAFKGSVEVGRSTGDTDKASIAQLFAKTS